MIEQLIIKSLDSIPIPLALGLVALFSVAWLIGQLHSLPNTSFVIKEPLFWGLAALIAVLEVVWFSYRAIDDKTFDVRFAEKETGIYVARFGNDADGRATKLFAAVLESRLKPEMGQQKLSVKTSNKPAAESENAAEIFASTKASIIVGGMLDQPKLLLKFIKYGDADWQSVRNFIDLRDPTEFVEILKGNITASNYKTRNAPDQNDLALLNKQIEGQNLAIAALQQEVKVLRDRLDNERRGTAGEAVRAKLNGKALITGINNYKNSELRLKYASADAREISEAIRRAGLETTLLLDEGATKARISEAFADEMRQQLKEDDLFLFYYSGHGVSVDGPNGEKAGYLCPTEFSVDKVPSTCISMREVGEWLTLLKARTIVLILDACVSGMIAEKLGTPRGFMAIRSAPPPLTYPAINGKTVVVFTAGKPDQLSLELSDIQHGLFTYFVLEGLHGRAPQSTDGRVAITDLYQYIYGWVEARSNGTQTPTLHIWGKTDVHLVGQQLDPNAPLPLSTR